MGGDHITAMSEIHWQRDQEEKRIGLLCSKVPGFSKSQNGCLGRCTFANVTVTVLDRPRNASAVKDILIEYKHREEMRDTTKF